MIRVLAVPAATALVLVACDPPPGAGGEEGGQAAPAVGELQSTPGGHLPSDADRAAILATVRALFDALGERDVDLLREVLRPGILMHSVERSAAGERSVSTSTLEDMVARLEAAGPRMTERMWDAEVRVSGDLAMVWTPYDFYVGEDLSHCGADAFILLREGADWRISSLSWTRLQPPECELHPDGPPG